MTAFHSRSPQIAAAARLLAVNWAFTLQLWMIAEGPALGLAYCLVDTVTAIGLYKIAQRRWFPVPLVFLHATLALYHLCTVFIDPAGFWVIFTLNRLFEIEMLYIIACSMFRIRTLRRRAVVKIRK